jgi:hypothetical protein
MRLSTRSVARDGRTSLRSVHARELLVLFLQARPFLEIAIRVMKILGMKDRNFLLDEYRLNV